MTTLSELENQERDFVIERWFKVLEKRTALPDDFVTGFQAGLAHNRARVEEYESTQEKIDLINELGEKDVQNRLVIQKQQVRIEQLEGLLRVALLEAYQNEVIDTGMEKSWIGPENVYADKEDWLEGKWAEWDEARVSARARASEEG